MRVARAVTVKPVLLQPVYAEKINYANEMQRERLDRSQCGVAYKR